MANELIVTNAAALAALVDKTTGDTLTAAEYTTLKDSVQEANVATRTANTVFAGPTTGAAAAPTFRALVAADIPSLSAVYQPLDATLTALAALGAGPGFLQVTGADTFSIAALSGAQVNTALGYTAANAASLNSSALTGNLPALNGSALTALNATNLGSGTIPDGRFPAVLPAVSGANLTNLPGGISGLTTGALPYASSGSALADSPLFRVDANTLAMRNGANVQALHIYGTYTDASNYERLGLTYTDAVSSWDITCDVAGTGVNRDLRFFGFVNAALTFRTATIGVYYPLSIKADFPPECYVRPGADVMDFGGPDNQWVHAYVGGSYQGGRTKALTHATDQSFLRVACPTAGAVVAGSIRYTIAAKDASNSSEGQSGTLHFVIRNQAGTVTVTPDATGNVAGDLANIGSIGTVTFKTSVAGTNADFIVNASTSLTTTAFTITSVPVITSGTAVVTHL